MRDIAAVVFLGAFLGALALMASAFVVMLYVGLWHSFNPDFAAVGFVDCMFGVGLVGLLSGLGARVTRR